MRSTERIEQFVLVICVYEQRKAHSIQTIFTLYNSNEIVRQSLCGRIPMGNEKRRTKKMEEIEAKEATYGRTKPYFSNLIIIQRSKSIQRSYSLLLSLSLNLHILIWSLNSFCQLLSFVPLCFLFILYLFHFIVLCAPWHLI